jgi:hypothetical protein
MQAAKQIITRNAHQVFMESSLFPWVQTEIGLRRDRLKAKPPASGVVQILDKGTSSEKHSLWDLNGKISSLQHSEHHPSIS